MDSPESTNRMSTDLDPQELQVGLRHMLLTRVFDDRMQRIQRSGKISFYMRSMGEEAISVAMAMALRPTDMLFPSYRNQGLQVARGREAAGGLGCQHGPHHRLSDGLGSESADDVHIGRRLAGGEGEDRVAWYAEPAQRLHQRRSEELLAASVPVALIHGGPRLQQSHRQQAAHAHGE